MSTAFVWNELKKVVILDHEINQLRKTAKKEQEHLTSAYVAHQKKLTLLHETELIVRTFQKELDQGELSIKALRGQLQRKRNQLASLTNNKERIAGEHEVSKVMADLDTLENTMIGVLEQQEVVKATLNKLKSEVALSTQATESLKSCIEKKCQECQSNIAVLENEWTTLLPLVPENLRNEYLQLKSRVNNPAVPVHNGACSACFMNLLNQEAAGLSTRAVIRCRNCYRFLYISDATTENLTGK